MVPLAFLVLAVAAQGGDKKGEVQRPVDFPVPPSPPLAPAEAHAAFRIAPGYRVELVAAEPDVVAPVALAFDADGRMWVVEMRGYMPDVDGRGEHLPVGQIAVLEDRDGDGRVDRRTTFLDGLVLPRAIALVENGILFAEPPGLHFARDVDGDLKCDERSVVDPAYCGRGNPEHLANGLLRAIDNWIYSARTGVRYRRHEGQWLRSDTRPRGQWGLAQDDLGRLYFNSNPEVLRGDATPCWSPDAHVRRGEGAAVLLIQDPSTWPARVNPGVNRGYRSGQLRPDGRLAVVTAACGPHVYRGDQFPEDARGDAFVCEPAGNLVKRVILEEEDGRVLARHAYDHAEFLASTDERFRPVNLCTGPDGALYVVDFHRGILQHRAYVTSFLRQQILSRGLEKPLDRGRIWRVVAEGRPVARPPRLHSAPSAELVRHLSHPNGWVRDTAQRLLVERRDASAVEALATVVRDGDDRGALHALFTLEGLLKLDPATLEAAARRPSLAAAAAALRLSSGPVGPLDAVLALAAEKKEIPDERLAGCELDLIEKIMAREEWQVESPERAALVARLSGRIAGRAAPGELSELIDLAAAQATAARWRQRALLEGLAERVPAAPVALPARSGGLLKLTWAEDESVRALARRLSERVTWPDRKAEPEPPRPAPLGEAERARFERGRRTYAASCAACHQLSGLGQDGHAPPLVDSEWVLGSPERLVRIVANGLRGAVRVNGRVYGGYEMPAVLNMTSEEIAEALTYIRREWGHQASPIDVSTVRRIRAALEDRDDPWTEAELLEIP
ncbi:MAG TPA: c-type cytochrome [Planctomycetota bacterium]|nr:c-type cytochrome [Planctomycetota bacterium]